ncbi:MAG: hypothetical protein AUI36_28310 [Cyanobacteria bacterium 13_1_40CM_2_61_4]|nr:MAG: hypothetical protein AUI36_28310 [Cyanobacteria bacterium 13_1_40CM_2_61_4]
MKITNGKQQLDEPPVFFLDRTFGRTELAAMLRADGFLIVTIYEEYGDAESRIADPVMICDCGFKSRVLLTADQDLVYTWAKEIVEAGIAVFVTTDNNEGPKQWGPRIISAKDDMLRELGRRKKPFTARISREGRVTQVRIYESAEWKTIPITKKNPSNFYRKK